MAEQAKPVADEPGAPIAKDHVDPDLIRLSRNRPKIGIVTAAGLVFLCGFFLLRLNPDRRFAGNAAIPDRVAVADVLSGNIALDRFIKLEAAEPLFTNAIRTTTAKGSLGLRVAPIRGTGERLWVAMSGDGWEQPAQGTYSGRLRKLSDLPFASSVAAYATEHPRPVFASASSLRDGFATNKVQTVSGDAVSIADADHVAFDVVDPNVAVIVATFNDRLPTLQAWSTALAAAGIAVQASSSSAEQARFDAAEPDAVAALTSRLEAAKLWAARVDPVTHHYDTTWGAIRGSSPAGIVVGGTTIPYAQLDLVGLYVGRTIPADAYAVIADERPDDYWYVLPISIALAAIGLVFAWALVRAVKRDLLPVRA